jgi:hypothetical protein
MEITAAMAHLIKQSVIISAVGAIALLFVGCGESKVAQCNKIITVTNKLVKFNQEEGKNAQTKRDVQSFNQFAAKLDEVTQELKAVQVQDEKLKVFQIGFVAVYEDLSRNLKDAATAIDKKNPQAINSISIKKRKNSGDSSSLVKEMNNYCASN